MNDPPLPVLRQIRIANNLKLTQKELEEIAVLLRKNAVESMKNLIERCKNFGYDLSAFQVHFFFGLQDRLRPHT
jgi:hypothetical protein